jgi:hypothetical protein
MNYSEDFFGIKYEAKRGEVLTITASADDYYICAWDGVLNLMNRSLCGRTALFVADCDFYTGGDQIRIKVLPGTPSYMKELSKVRKVTADEASQHRIGKLW